MLWKLSPRPTLTSIHSHELWTWSQNSTFFGHSQKPGLSEAFWLSDRRNVEIRRFPQVWVLIWFELWKIKIIWEAQTKQQQGREKPSCLPATLSNMSGRPLRISLGERPEQRAVSQSAFGDTNYFTVHSSSPRIWYVEISGEIAWQPLCLGEMNTHTSSPCYRQHQYNLGACWNCRISVPTPNLLNQNLPSKTPGDSCAYPSTAVSLAPFPHYLTVAPQI